MGIGMIIPKPLVVSKLGSLKKREVLLKNTLLCKRLGE
jgi:hypothetical protein